MAGLFEGWTFLFDLDGTLVDTAPDLVDALNHTLTAEGLTPVDPRAVHPLIGHGARAMIERGLEAQGAWLDADRLEAAFARFIDHYCGHIADASRPFPGAVAVLDILKAAGARLAICTNKRQDLSDRLLQALRLAPHFDAVMGADRASRKKPDAAHVLETLGEAGGRPERAIFIGDSRTDERAARNAGLPFVFCTFGYEIEPVQAIAADATINHYDELIPALSMLKDQAEASLLRGR